VLPFSDDGQRDVLQECDASACAKVLQLREHGFMAIQRVSHDRVRALLFVGQERHDDIA
jgi:hypothetical protein